MRSANKAVIAAVLTLALPLAGGTSVAAQGYSVAPSVRQRPAMVKPRIAAVIEGVGDKAFGARVRSLMARHLSLEVLDLGDVDGADKQPDIVISIAASRPKDIHVLYWDRTGATDMLTAPSSGGQGSVGLVAASLAVAVVRKHLDALASNPDNLVTRSKRPGAWVTPTELRRFFSQLVPVRHRTEGLSEADF